MFGCSYYTLVVMTIFSLRSIHRLTQLERLDLGSNEFSDVVRLLDVIISKGFRQCESINCVLIWIPPFCLSAGGFGTDSQP